MKQPRRYSGLIFGLLALGLLAGMALMAPPAQAVDAVGPYYADPAWDQSLPVVTRFVVLTNWGSTAVLDKETGLVWERSPATGFVSWADARRVCTALTTGGRKGWRLPSIPELESLIDPSVAFPGPTLPPGHPFLTFQSGLYWSATTVAGNPIRAWDVTFFDGNMNSLDKTSNGRVWCVRGGNNADAY